MRLRKLPARHVLWLVIGMALLRDRSIDAVVAHLGLVLGEPHEPVSKAAIPPARARLGSAPLEYLFNVSAKHWALESIDEHYTWRGLSIWAADGSRRCAGRTSKAMKSIASRRLLPSTSIEQR